MPLLAPLAAALVAGAVALASAAPAVAATPSPSAQAAALRVEEVLVAADARSVELRLSAVGLPAGEGLDTSSITARVGDRRLPASAQAVVPTRAEPPSVLLVVDTSGSMEGAPLEQAKQAVSGYVADAPVDVRVGLLAFGSAPRLLVPPTLERPRLLGAVSGLQAQGETALYDAVAAALEALGSTGDRRVIVLSDGGDTRSALDLEQVLRRTAASGVVLDAVGFATDEGVTATLGRLAQQGQGQVRTAADAGELSAALAATSARSWADALTLRLLVPDDVRGERLTLSARTRTTPLTVEVPLDLAVAAPAAPPRGFWGSRGALAAGLAAVAVGLLLTGLALVPGRDADRKRLALVLDRYTTLAPAPKPDLRTASPVTRTALQLAERVATARDGHERRRLRLERAGVPLTPAEWLLLQAGVAVGLLLLLVLLGASPLLALALSALAGGGVPRLVLLVRGSRRQRAFEEALPEALQMTAASLSAGYSLAQALDGLVREAPAPMSTEIGRALAESRLGVPVETTLGAVAERMASKDFGWVVMAIRVQREVGGNLAGILTTVAGTMRERAGLRRHVSALSAEGRLSAYILLGLPVFLFGYMVLVNREYVQPLYSTGLGIALLVAAGLLMGVGSVVMSRMVKVEV